MASSKQLPPINSAEANAALLTVLTALIAELRHTSAIDSERFAAGLERLTDAGAEKTPGFKSITNYFAVMARSPLGKLDGGTGRE